MLKAFAIIIGLVILGGAFYAVTRPNAVDPKSAALAEALALHARAVKTAVAEECTEARARLTEWRTMRAAGTPAPEDNRKSRKMLRQMLRSGCRGHG